MTLSQSVVINFANQLAEINHHIYFDNLFTGIELLNKLTEIKQYGCGTIRINRKGLPQDFPLDKEMKRGETSVRFKKNLTVLKWKDNRSVLMAANYESSGFKSIKRREKNGKTIWVDCPNIIHQYNKHMSGVDHMDQMINLYLRDRKSKKYWIRIFFYLFI